MTETVNESRRYIKKLEGERTGRDKLEDDLKHHKKREQELERQALDLHQNNENLRQRVRL